MRAEHLAQRRVEQVGAGVIAADGIATFAVDYGADVVANAASGKFEQEPCGRELLERGEHGA